MTLTSRSIMPTREDELGVERRKSRRLTCHKGKKNRRNFYFGLMFESSLESACEHSKDEGGNVNFHLMSLKQILLRKLG